MTALANLKKLCKDNGCGLEENDESLYHHVINITAPSGYHWSGGEHSLVTSINRVGKGAKDKCRKAALEDLQNNLPHMEQCEEECECFDK
jgi:hypothetical protein